MEDLFVNAFPLIDWAILNETPTGIHLEKN